jgi:hypothetical protein
MFENNVKIVCLGTTVEKLFDNTALFIALNRPADKLLYHPVLLLLLSTTHFLGYFILTDWPSTDIFPRWTIYIILCTRQVPKSLNKKDLQKIMVTFLNTVVRSRNNGCLTQLTV